MNDELMDKNEIYLLKKNSFFSKWLCGHIWVEDAPIDVLYKYKRY